MDVVIEKREKGCLQLASSDAGLLIECGVVVA